MVTIYPYNLQSDIQIITKFTIILDLALATPVMSPTLYYSVINTQSIHHLRHIVLSAQLDYLQALRTTFFLMHSHQLKLSYC